MNPLKTFNRTQYCEIVQDSPPLFRTGSFEQHAAQMPYRQAIVYILDEHYGDGTRLE